MISLDQDRGIARISPISGGLQGSLKVPGDKSISHRALLLGGIAEGTTQIKGLLEGEDCLATLRAMQEMGARVEKTPSGEYLVEGVGSKGLQEPGDVLDLGNSGTATRLLIGLIAGYPIAATLTGDSSVRRRPMLRVVDPIRSMGATIVGRQNGDKVPLTVLGGNLTGMEYASPLASAQVKSCVLLAGLQATGETVVIEPAATRDHSERMLNAFGADIYYEPGKACVTGGKTLQAQPVLVPGDISSAAFFLIAGLVVPDSEITLHDIGLNPTRTGLLDALEAMGANIEVRDAKEIAGEPIGDLRVKTSQLKGAEIGGDLVPRMIDEFPILTLAALRAEGRTVIRDARELRFKESDRISAIIRQFKQMGVKIDEQEDGYIIDGPQQIHSGKADSEGDHRIAMTLIISALLADGDSEVLQTPCIDTSFPDFFSLLDSVCPK